MSRKTRNIKLSVAEREMLEKAHKTHGTHIVRQRCLCLLLSAEGKSRKELIAFFKVRPNTIGEWFDRWEKGHTIKDLETKPGRGRKPKISTENAEMVSTLKRSVKKNARKLDAVLADLQSEHSVSMSKSALKKFLKKVVTVGSDFDDL
jgi:transposase